MMDEDDEEDDEPLAASDDQIVDIQSMVSLNRYL